MTETTQYQLHIFQISSEIKRICSQLHCAIYHKKYTDKYSMYPNIRVAMQYIIIS